MFRDRLEHLSLLLAREGIAEDKSETSSLVLACLHLGGAMCAEELKKRVGYLNEFKNMGPFEKRMTVRRGDVAFAAARLKALKLLEASRLDPIHGYFDEYKRIFFISITVPEIGPGK